MRLAEALILRADLNKRLAQARERLLRVVRVQEGEAPAEDPGEVLGEHDRMASELESLIARINRTNLAVPVAPYGTMTDALARRDALRLRIEVRRAALVGAATSAGRTTRSEVRYVATVDVRSLQGETDRMSREYRELETAVQAANWANDLLAE